MGLNEIRNAQGSRKWFQFCCLIIESMNDTPIDQLVDIFLESAGHIHPRSSCEVFVRLAERLGHDEGVKMLSIGQDMLSNVVLYSEDFEMERILLEMKKCLLLVETESLRGIERKLFEWKEIKMNKDMSMMYNLLGFRFYRAMKNIESGFRYLLKYVKLSSSEDMMDILVEYAMLNKEFFNFTSITSLPGFDNMKNHDLKEIFMLFREGDVEGLRRSDTTFIKIFGDDSEMVREKIYMIALINLCFAEVEKKVSIEKIERSLGISEKTSTYMILKSFGLELIDGWIDGENRILYFNRIAPRSLQIDEVQRIKERFSGWEQRVGEVISMLE